MPEVERLLTRLVVLSRSIEGIIFDLRQLRFPSESPLWLASVIGSLTEVVCDNMIQRYKSLVNYERTDFANQIKLAHKLLERFAAHLRFVERARIDQTPFGLVRILEGLTRKLYPMATFIIRPQWHYNFSEQELISTYRKWLQEKYSGLLSQEKLDEVLSVLTGRNINNLYVLAFPRVERDHVLSHVVLGHELGHPLADIYLKHEEVETYQTDIWEAICGMFQTERDTGSVPVEKIGEALTLYNNAITIRSRALEELIADVVNVHIFGAAALFCTEELAITQILDSVVKMPPEDHYPPWRYRLRVMHSIFPRNWIQDVTKEGFFDKKTARCLKNKWDQIEGVINQETDMDELKSEPTVQIAYKSVRKALPAVKQFVAEKMEAKGLSLSSLPSLIKAGFLKRLEHLNPPDAFIRDREEIPGEIRGILNVGWFQMVCKYPSLPIKGSKKDMDAFLSNVDILNRLVNKALECSDIRCAWRRWVREGVIHDYPST